jgi:hypothetical protein
MDYSIAVKKTVSFFASACYTISPAQSRPEPTFSSSASFCLTSDYGF